MESQRFDELTRLLANGASRRRILRGLAASLFGGAVGIGGRAAAAATPCASARDCPTRLCFDGFCCNRSCTGQCEACNLPGLEGTCSPVSGAPVGTRPACGGSGPCAAVCDGQTRTRCTGYPGGETACGDATCADGFQTTYACSGNGTCAPTTTPCGLYFCLDDGSGCRTTCEGDEHCAGTAFCDDGGQCQGDKALGEPCNDGAECLHGQCAQGVCCDSACDGVCRACNLDGNAGFCSEAPDGGPCAGGTCCDGECIDTESDLAHCGGCDIACEAGPTIACCDGACVDTNADKEHCGACGVFCGDSLFDLCCDGVCTNAFGNEEHCGACDNQCDTASGQVCRGSRCCSATTGPCQVNDDCCNFFDLGDALVGDLCCDGVCVDSQRDEANCGACDVQCDTGAGERCAGGGTTPGTCCLNTGVACVSDDDCCSPDLCCDGVCTNTTFNTQHCEACNNVCVGEQVCRFEGCCIPDGEDCVTDADCCSGNRCCGGVCSLDQLGGQGDACEVDAECCGDLFCDGVCCGDTGVACQTDADCCFGQPCCGGRCVDPERDLEHCGVCDNACLAGQECDEGDCCGAPGSACLGDGDCCDGDRCCDGFCRTVFNDEEFCGDCETACAPEQQCSAGACCAEEGASCATDDDCCFSTVRCCGGVCTETFNSPEDCGACDIQCDTGVGEICQGGNCCLAVNEACQSDDDCCGSNLCCAGVCTNVTFNEQHCEACNNACATDETCRFDGCCGATGAACQVHADCCFGCIEEVCA
ncbi:MAG: hypothetical protein ACRDJH_11605 [Thermomicrobiales bacterium]